MDILSGLPETARGNKQLLVVGDYFTRFKISIPLPDMKAATVAEALSIHVICKFDVPRSLLTDRGSNFTSEYLKDVCGVLRVKQVWTTAYHPQTDGMVERFNATLCTMLKAYVSKAQTDWDLFAGYVTKAYNAAYHPTLLTSPYQLLFGRVPLSRIESVDVAKDDSVPKAMYATRLQQTIAFAEDAVRKRYETLQHRRDMVNAAKDPLPKYAVGDLVLLYTPVVLPGESRKLTEFWTGPYRVTAGVSPWDYSIVNDADVNPKSRLVHVARLKPYTASDRVDVLPIDAVPLEDMDLS